MNIILERRSGQPKRDFIKLWLEAVEKTGNNIVAGFDPENTTGIMNRFDVWEMGKKYIDEVIPHVAAIKFNTKFFLEQGWFDELAILIQYTKSKSCIVIGDSKLADIGKSLSAGLQSSVNKKMDFETLDTRTSRVTVGIQKEFGQQIGLVAVALMSNKEAIEYNSTPEGGEEVLRYLKHVLDAGVVGVVIGGTYKNEQAFKDALEIIKKHESETGRKILILAPGFGAQGGNISEFLTTVKNAGLDPKQVMCNVGTSLMQPELGKTRTQVVKEFMDGAKSIF